ncbi:hypothetical protein D8674_021547 [Pyrus ussuriensis x Pyrus communis]|uniref:Uncharacterized protein n=1 Tax=Pyrus ussuriensis x Pyrus communis TaxID=2448454 RepID=A0A5N5GHF7_9ROSA|nr:hypothetical protein D8674_021547 [Pyrus ussuriensis x Pyrus communis]
MPRASNDPQGTTIAPREGGDLARRYPPYMDQIWETLTKICIFVEKLQKNQTSAQAESHYDFVDMQRQMKNLENSSGTTPHTKFPPLDLEA